MILGYPHPMRAHGAKVAMPLDELASPLRRSSVNLVGCDRSLLWGAGIRGNCDGRDVVLAKHLLEFH